MINNNRLVKAIDLKFSQQEAPMTGESFINKLWSSKFIELDVLYVEDHTPFHKSSHVLPNFNYLITDQANLFKRENRVLCKINVLAVYQ